MSSLGSTMFISDVVEKIWEEKSVEYEAHHERASKMDAHALLEALSGKRMEFVSHESNRTNGNLLLTSGCSYRIRGRKLSGCSMCDYHTTNIDGWAMMRALRKKSPELYAIAVKRSMVDVRGTSPTPAFCEQVTANDCLDPVEFPVEVLDELFTREPLFDGQPFCYMFEVLPSNVTPERLALFKEGFGDQRRLFFDFGVEATAWIREHWLNKRIGDPTIARAIRAIQDAGYFAMADMIIGIPGLTEEQSIDVFVDTVVLLESMGVDRIVCLPLNRKETTLQGYLHRRLGTNARLASVGLANGEHTGVPWLFTVLEALCRLRDISPTIFKKLSLAATRPRHVTGESVTAYNARRDCSCNEDIVNALETYQKRRDPSEAIRVKDALRDHACFAQYRELLERQRHAGSLAETLRLVAGEIARDLFHDDWQSRISGFESELARMPPSGR